MAQVSPASSILRFNKGQPAPTSSNNACQEVSKPHAPALAGAPADWNLGHSAYKY